MYNSEAQSAWVSPTLNVMITYNYQIMHCFVRLEVWTPVSWQNVATRLMYMKAEEVRYLILFIFINMKFIFNFSAILTNSLIRPSLSVNMTQQAQNICIIFIQRRPNVFDVGPTLYKCYTDVLCLLGISTWCWFNVGLRQWPSWGTTAIGVETVRFNGKHWAK